MLERLQYRMAEVVFRPFRVLSLSWKGGRAVSAKYTLAAWAVFLPTLGFGLWLGKGLSGDPFRLDTQPTTLTYIGLAFAGIWLFFTLYVALVAIALGLLNAFGKPTASE